MAAESFWNYAVDPRQQVARGGGDGRSRACVWQQSGHQHAAVPVRPPSPQPQVAPPMAPAPQVARVMAPPPVPAGAPPLKRLRPDYFDMPSGQESSGFHEAMGASYGHHLKNEMPYVGASQIARPLSGMATYPVDNPQKMGVMGLDSRNMGSARTDPALRPDISNTLYVEGLLRTARGGRLHVFRPFSAFCEVRLANKESRHSGRYHVLCFDDFDTPAQALVALETLQGYKFDEHDSCSANLRLQFSLSWHKVRWWASW